VSFLPSWSRSGLIDTDQKLDVRQGVPPVSQSDNAELMGGLIGRRLDCRGGGNLNQRKKSQRIGRRRSRSPRNR